MPASRQRSYKVFCDKGRNEIERAAVGSEFITYIWKLPKNIFLKKELSFVNQEKYRIDKKN